MSYKPLYQAVIIQTTNTISSSIDASRTVNTITGSWVKIDTGSFNFISSGSFSGTSASYTGSLSINVAYERKNASDTGSISLTRLDNNTLRLQTQAYPMTAQLSDSVIQGTCSIDVGIYY
jgi:hypothetical protein